MPHPGTRQTADATASTLPEGDCVPLSHAGEDGAQFRGAGILLVVMMALIASSVLSNVPIILTIAMSVLGVLLGTVDSNMISGKSDGSISAARPGINFVALAVAPFAFSNVLARAGQAEQNRRFDRIKGLLPPRADLAAFRRDVDCQPGPVVLGFIPGPITEINPRRTLLSQGDFSVFVTRPTSLGFLRLAAGLLPAIALAPLICVSRNIRPS